MIRPDENELPSRRRKTVTVHVGGVPMGSDHPVRIQSMANTSTADITGSVAQCIRIIKAGAEFVRFTVPSISDVDALAAIRQQLRKLGYQTPIIADVHFNPDIALKVAAYVDKVRVNPGNFADIGKFIELLEICHANHTAVRIGVNHGSLSERIMEKFGDTPEGMAESAMEFLRICREKQFDQVVVSMKASNVRVMIQSTRLTAEKMDREGMHFPLHLGVTEAGEGEDGRIKSAVGIATLLADGLGDTIRVSLTEEPEAEIPVARKLVSFANSTAQEGKPVDWSGAQTDYYRRPTHKTGNIGGNLPPLVYGLDDPGSNVNLLHATSKELTADYLNKLKSELSAVLVYEPSANNVQHELRWLRHTLDEANCKVPVIFRLHLQDNNEEDFMLHAAANLGGAFIAGFGDGIWLTNDYPLPQQQIHSVSLGVLQAARIRMSKTEYIACPSCGRTNFNLIEALAHIKAATSHLKGLKIGVMGCIVNGPGEMADADYGYVGAGKGKITLYKSKEVVKRGVPESEAVEELIMLIKEYGDWKEPD
ncbi:MAG: (E)-4-hydroxy-3-methylbut-2-enyl-diphosphate synthase [Bacteroidales bacterium]|nr:(E)-4-hydroxy-3-methylbut-2-enyl-diphosphate synthase [Bacteroidales bacterium]